MLSEKEKKVKETMKIMGMNLPVYYLTWFLRYFVCFVIISFIGGAIVSRELKHVNFIIPFVVFILFDCVLIVQSFFIQTFFSRAKIGVVIALLFFILQFIVTLVALRK